jgi:hypothetical protein
VGTPGARADLSIPFAFIGLRKPMVLRPNSVAFQLVGEAYVHGRMDGEAMTGVKAGKCSMPVLEIV